ncbi:uncharacterized protein LOC131658129 [Vicia villosa]|uniref:uncharacterized protein LOC131658129 n=1 Tax=Vicia villosa TaxID=3911 RepID=UPI00273C651C|nr:uncharacterized protein LOC131658129 [Vicia villosa]
MVLVGSQVVVRCDINIAHLYIDINDINIVKTYLIALKNAIKSRSGGQNIADIIVFSKWIFEIGEGKVGESNDGVVEIDILLEILITSFDNPIVAIVDSTYLNFLENYKLYDYLKCRGILASTIEIVDQINDYILQLMLGENKDHFSYNSIDRSEIHDNIIVDILSPDFLSSLRSSELPNHHIKLKVGTPIMLIRNIDQSQSLCNGTRLVVTKMVNHILEARDMGGKGHGNIIYIPRMDMPPSDSTWPFKLNIR